MLCKETVHPDTFQLLTELSQNRELSNFQLVGGTALSLQLGHRISTDLDLFSAKDFDTDLVRGILDKYQDVKYNETGKNLVQGFVNNIKVDFACHKYKTIKEGIRLNNIRISSKEDITAMKFAAVLSRAKKRDFIDLAAILKETPLNQMLDSFKRKYDQHRIFHVIRALGYFKDAENDNTPLKVLKDDLRWDKSKKIISQAIKAMNKSSDMSIGI